MSVSNYTQLSPRFTDAAPSGPSKVRSRMQRLAGELSADLAKPASEVDAGRLTLTGAQLQRRQAAARVLPLLEAERANLDALEAERIAAHESQLRAAADAEAKLPASVLARAHSTVAMFTGGAATTANDAQTRARFVRAVDAGELDAVYAAMMLSPYGPMADIATRGRERFLLSVVPLEKVRELRALTVALGIVRGEFASFLDEVRAIAKNGTEAAPDARALLARANDNDRLALVTEGIALGIFLPPSTSTGSPSTAGADRVAAVAASASSNVGTVRTGGR